MDGKEGLKQLYKAFGKKKEDESQMDSIANVFYELGNENESKDENKSEEVIKCKETM